MNESDQDKQSFGRRRKMSMIHIYEKEIKNS
jgi:hypothetical protein